MTPSEIDLEILYSFRSTDKWYEPAFLNLKLHTSNLRLQSNKKKTVSLLKG